MEKIPYQELVPSMQTGDLVLFNGQYEGSRFIEWLEGSEWSHVGMVVRHPSYEEPLLWEATSLVNLPDVLFQDKKPGPKLVVLQDRLSHYGDELKKYKEARFAYRKLDVKRTPGMLSILEGLMTSLHGIPDPGFWEMIWEVFLGRILRIRVKLDHYFCSELIAETYCALGLISHEIPINAFMPSDFSDQGKLRMMIGSLAPEVLIDIKHL